MSPKKLASDVEGGVSTKKKIRESKNRKKYWKKADISDVEQFLESKRFDERVGDVSLKSDDQIFSVEKKSAPESEAQFQKKRSDVLKESLKCHAILDQFSSVPVPYSVSRQRSEDEKKSKFHIEQERMTLRKRIAKASTVVDEKAKARKVKEAKPKCKTLNTETEIFDLWGESPQKESKKTESGCHIDVLEEPRDAEVLTKDQLAYVAKTLRKSRPKILINRQKKPSKLPAVEVAKPGASYKPTHEDHQDLLEEANDVEVDKLRKEQHLERVLTDLFPNEQQAKQNRVSNKLQEAVGILYSDSDGDDDEDDHSGVPGNPPVLAEHRKTRVQRNRQKAHKERLKAAAAKRAEKKLDTTFGRINVYKQEIKKANKITKAKIEARVEKEAEDQFKPKRLGKHRFRPAEIEVKLSDEMPQSLRQLKPEGNLLVDRMRSFEKRNIIEPRRKCTRRKLWTKKVYKRNFKKGFEDTLTTPKVDKLY